MTKYKHFTSSTVYNLKFQNKATNWLT